MMLAVALVVMIVVDLVRSMAAEWKRARRYDDVDRLARCRHDVPWRL